MSPSPSAIWLRQLLLLSLCATAPVLGCQGKTETGEEELDNPGGGFASQFGPRRPETRPGIDTGQSTDIPAVPREQWEARGWWEQCRDAPEGATTSEECPPYQEDGCCNPNVALPVYEDGKCCYPYADAGCCGRPLLVEGQARVAGLVTREDWVAAKPETTALPPELGRRRAALWREEGLMEHASVASFARFSLELMAVGAPPALLRAASAAAADEVRHARACFGIARALDGQDLGPGPLPLHGLTLTPELVDIVVRVVAEACVGETLAALEARERARQAGDATVKRVLLGIAEDEARHAALGWQTLRWAWSQLSTADQATVHQAMNDALESILRETAPPPLLPPALVQHFGRLLPAERQELRREAVEQVLRPVWGQLLAVPRYSRQASA